MVEINSQQIFLRVVCAGKACIGHIYRQKTSMGLDFRSYKKAKHDPTQKNKTTMILKWTSSIDPYQ